MADQPQPDRAGRVTRSGTASMESSLESDTNSEGADDSGSEAESGESETNNTTDPVHNDGTVHCQEKEGHRQVAIIPEVDDSAATAISVVFPKKGEQFANLKVYQSLPQLLNVDENVSKIENVVTFRKQRSASVYSFIQVTTAPHLTHPAQETRAIQGAAAAAGLPQLSLNGNKSVVQEDASFLAPGTPEYQSLGLEQIFAGVDEKTLGAILNGCVQVGMKAPLNDQKAREFGGGSRKTFNFGVGFGGHSYVPGAKAPEGKFAPPGLVNLNLVEQYFPDKGECLGVLFEALGKAQEAILERLKIKERPDKLRNSGYAGEVGLRLHKPGCQAGECIFLTLECSKSPIMQGVMDRINSKLKTKEADGQQVHIHVDPQDPAPDSPYSRATLATWTLYFPCEGKVYPVQMTGILCNRLSVCDYKIKNAAAKKMHSLYQKGVRRFATVHPGIRYEDDGLGLFGGAKPLIMTYLKDEKPANDKPPGCWVGHIEADKPGRYKLIGAKNSKRFLKTVGDQRLECNRKCDRDPVAEGTSAVEDIKKSSILHGRMHAIRAYPNKMGAYSGQRAAAKLVAKKFKLNNQHIWDLFYCHLQHNRAPGIFIAKCLSLTEQWEELWAPPNEFGVQWMEACEADSETGNLASLFLNSMNVHLHTGNVSSFLCRETSSHIQDLDFTPEFCRNEIEKLRRFADDLKGSDDNRSTTDILKKSMTGGDKTLGNMKGIGEFLFPQIPTGIFLWGLLDIPCWRAADCPILDPEKKHFKQCEIEAVDEHATRADSTKKKHKFKSVEALHRCLLIVAHEERVAVLVIENGTCEGVRGNEVFDFLLQDMDSFDLRPSEDSNPYCPCYQLWCKAYGPDEEWRLIDPADIQKVLRMDYY